MLREYRDRIRLLGSPILVQSRRLDRRPVSLDLGDASLSICHPFESGVGALDQMLVFIREMIIAQWSVVGVLAKLREHK